ncbi:unnamed protein product [Linum trigynum]|uniref:Uncharacterized protein n=1 Tax=Linum trigynum TaxID=586398 RepID=A0AAV2E8V6_9ROSI
MLEVLKEEINMNANRSRNVKIVAMIEKACGSKEKRRPHVAVVVKHFLLVALGSLLAPTSSRIYKLDYAGYLAGRVENIRTECSWDIHFLMLHLLDFLIVRGLATNTIPSWSYWFEPRVDKFYKTDWWEEIDLETIETEELKALQSLSEKAMDKWDSRRESV